MFSCRSQGINHVIATHDNLERAKPYIKKMEGKKHMCIVCSRVLQSSTAMASHVARTRRPTSLIFTEEGMFIVRGKTKTQSVVRSKPMGNRYSNFSDIILYLVLFQ